MDCIVDGEKCCDDSEEVTFLYRLCDGSSPRSYGINVARLAQLPAEVIKMAMKQSRDFEAKMKGKSITADNDMDTDNISSASKLSRTAAVVFFDRLVSVADSNLPPNELVFVATEMWKRFVALCADAETNT